MSERKRFHIDLSSTLIAEGYYVVREGVLDVTDADGSPVPSAHRLRPNDKPEAIAKFYLRKSLQPNQFNRPLAYTAQSF